MKAEYFLLVVKFIRGSSALGGDNDEKLQWRAISFYSFADNRSSVNPQKSFRKSIVKLQLQSSIISNLQKWDQYKFCTIVRYVKYTLSSYLQQCMFHQKFKWVSATHAVACSSLAALLKFSPVSDVVELQWKKSCPFNYFRKLCFPERKSWTLKCSRKKA